MSIAKRDLLARLLDRSGSTRLMARAPAWRGLLVLNYHRIGDPDATQFDRGVFSATDEVFADQIRYLTQHFDLVTPADLDRILRDDRGRYVMLTFDDGYRDNYEAAFPILRAYGASAVFFITTGFLDDHTLAWWDDVAWMIRHCDRSELPAGPWTNDALPIGRESREPAIRALLRIFKQLPTDKTPEFLDWLADACATGRAPATAEAAPWMTWDMVREMHAAGMEIGGHTVTHPVLANLPPDAQRREIRDSKTRIEAEIGQRITTFSYPVGQPDSFDAGTQALLNESGFRWAFSFCGGLNRRKTIDPLNISRVAVEADASPAMFRSTTCLPQLFA